MPEKEIRELLEKQREYFATGITRSYAFRRRELKKLKKAIKEKEADFRSVLRKSFVPDSNLRYPPYRPLTGVSKKLFDLFG